MDEFDTLRRTRERMRYYYDYLGRPALLVWEPDNRDVETIHDHRRFLYDSEGLLAELATDRQGQAQETRGRYINHPTRDEIIEMQVQSSVSGSFRTLVPHFAFDGELASLSDDAGRTLEVETVFDALPRRYSRLVRRLKGEQVEVALLSRGYLLDPFTANPLHYAHNGVSPDITRNLDKEWTALVQHSADRFAELNHELQREVMHIMGWSFLPAVVFEPWILLGASIDVLFDFGLSLAFGWDYSFDDAMLTFKYGIPFAAFAVEARLLARAVDEAIEASIEASMRAASRRSARNLAENVPDDEVLRRLLKEAPGFPDEPRPWWDPPDLVHNLPDDFPGTVRRFSFARWMLYREAMQDLGLPRWLVRHIPDPGDALFDMAAGAVRVPGYRPLIVLLDGAFPFDWFLHGRFGSPTIRMVLAHELGHILQPWRLYRMSRPRRNLPSSARRSVENALGEASASLLGARVLLDRGYMDEAIRLYFHSVGPNLDRTHQLLATVASQPRRGIVRAQIYARDVIGLRRQSNFFWALASQAQQRAGRLP